MELPRKTIKNSESFADSYTKRGKLEQFRLFTFLAKHFDDSKVYRIFADENNLLY